MVYRSVLRRMGSEVAFAETPEGRRGAGPAAEEGGLVNAAAGADGGLDPPSFPPPLDEEAMMPGGSDVSVAQGEGGGVTSASGFGSRDLGWRVVLDA